MVVYVVIDEPNVETQSKSVYAQEVAKAILEEALPYLNIFPTEPVKKTEAETTQDTTQDTTQTNEQEQTTQDNTQGNETQDNTTQNSEQDTHDYDLPYQSGNVTEDIMSENSQE